MTGVEPTTPAINVVHVDDDADFRYLMRIAYRKSGLPGRLWSLDGAEALMDFLHRRGEHAGAPCPDLLIIDYEMPGMDGAQTVTMLKNDLMWKWLPMVMLSSAWRPPGGEGVWSERIAGFLIKPDGTDRLVEQLRSLLPLLQSPFRRTTLGDQP